jgi:predicted SPOUT superfamily RNA methylase MTH1
MHEDLKFAGLLAPLDTPHHVRADEASPFREGVVLDKCNKDGSESFVHIGMRKDARLDRKLRPGMRVTVKLDKANADPAKKNHAGVAVAPSAPREELGLYWGYSTRLAASLGEVFEKCPFPEGYDLTLGTSERGTSTVDDDDFALRPYRHLLIVFGGVLGIEAR